MCGFMLLLACVQAKLHAEKMELASLELQRMRLSEQALQQEPQLSSRTLQNRGGKIFLKLVQELARIKDEYCGCLGLNAWNAGHPSEAR